MKKTLRSDTVKIIAMICMLIDHIGIGIISPMYLKATDYNKSVAIYNFYLVFRSIGRMAFPLFCYQLVNGFYYTKSRIKHLSNLVLFAIISEIPFDLFDEGVPFNPNYQNVVITLLIGTIMMWIFEWSKTTKIYDKAVGNRRLLTIYYLALFSIASIFAYIAYLLKIDYGARGIILIAIIYFLHNDKTLLIQIGPPLFIIDMVVVTFLMTHNIHSTIKYCQFEIYAIAAFLFMYLDNGERRGGKVLKWFGYWFYPAHMLMLYLVVKLTGLQM